MNSNKLHQHQNQQSNASSNRPAHRAYCNEVGQFLREKKDDPNSAFTRPKKLTMSCTECAAQGRDHFGHYLSRCPCREGRRATHVVASTPAAPAVALGAAAKASTKLVSNPQDAELANNPVSAANPFYFSSVRGVGSDINYSAASLQAINHFASSQQAIDPFVALGEDPVTSILPVLDHDNEEEDDDDFEKRGVTMKLLRAIKEDCLRINSDTEYWSIGRVSISRVGNHEIFYPRRLFLNSFLSHDSVSATAFSSSLTSWEILTKRDRKGEYQNAKDSKSNVLQETLDKFKLHDVSQLSVCNKEQLTELADCLQTSRWGDDVDPTSTLT